MPQPEIPTPRYHHFILQLRQEANLVAGKPPVWRVSLEDPHSGERKGFRSVEELAEFLHSWMQTPPDLTTKNQS